MFRKTRCELSFLFLWTGKLRFGGAMLVKIISIAFNSALGGFSDTELRDFIKDVEVISIADHLFVRNEIPYLTLIIKYFPLRQEANPKLSPQGKRSLRSSRMMRPWFSSGFIESSLLRDLRMQIRTLGKILQFSENPGNGRELRPFKGL